jgi:lipopolysaccharide/colanic/teichoic acid biosynthesis glycosyltransferase
MLAMTRTIRQKRMYAPQGRKPLGRPPKAQLSKRLFDLILAAALFIFLAPLLLLMTLAIKVDGGPALGSRHGIFAPKVHQWVGPLSAAMQS